MSSVLPKEFQEVGPARSSTELANVDVSARNKPEPALAAPHPAPQGDVVGGAEWDEYHRAMEALRQAGVRFLLGGAFGLGAYTGRWRNTKDMDFFLLPRDREVAVQALTQAGFLDYYETLAYDRGWIYRSTRSEVIVDLIWSTPNRRTEVDDLWFVHCRHTRIRDQDLGVIPAEELVWIKLYVLQRDRCDWPDVINLLYSTSSWLDWDRLVARMGEDLPLLLGILNVFAWLCPTRANTIPASLRKRLNLRKSPRTAPDIDRHHVDLLDSRPWFAALQPE